ncbi:hypothetical protein ELUMI_v1c05120 [Williamsoniiplasma luminosum]|uniref:Uncharacterized protein n=1 Tax=Williamsoniiplasma luminosum TaxID=214888 RepID=A0A2K8NUL7_9MOLU|nr:hypothetical protein [Williamsoniiplasma luminosum]ATZ17236.1 hypothetical protein ELUMI_v1c05120 [Williamsoniiplasma luminosum]
MINFYAGLDFSGITKQVKEWIGPILSIVGFIAAAFALFAVIRIAFAIVKLNKEDDVPEGAMTKKIWQICGVGVGLAICLAAGTIGTLMWESLSGLQQDWGVGGNTKMLSVRSLVDFYSLTPLLKL